MSNQKASNPKFDLEAMTLEELWSLHETISGVLSSRIKAEKHELEKRLAILNRGITAGPAANSGSLGERPRRSYPAVLPKYRNPQTSETWSGRGKRPRWLAAAMKSGRKIEEFRIKEAVGARGRQRG
jgi:DNA-binding protein H-NS